MKIELARLNHILIPKGKEGRERWRRSLLGRAVRPFFLLFWGALSDEGRMLLLTAFVVGALSADVRATTGYVFFSVVTGVLAGSLVASRTLRIRDVSVVVDAPRRVTIGEPVTFTVVCKRAPSKGEAPSPPQPLRIRGPFLPWDGRWLDEPPPEIVVPSHADGRASTTMRARFIARGLHVLDSFTAAAVVPGGLACGTRESSDEVKLHVVPRVAKVMRLPFVIASRHQPGGVALASKSGEAMDLLGVRPYRAGDPVRDLHARSWARTGVPVVREYQQEYFTRVGVVLDTDVADEGRLEAAIELAAGVIAHLAHGETLIDVLVVGDRVHELTLGRSLGSLDQALELLASVERGPKLRAADLLRRLDPYVARLSSVIVIALADDDERKAVERGIAGKGIAAKTLLVDAALEKDIRARKELAFE
ncbi:MAG: DUF58 domain-containing protein [Deltaproteobacteria bacterium]|nr:DUF58 domain-containing protein [Deltaproteobacteria bacterium]